MCPKPTLAGRPKLACWVHPPGLTWKWGLVSPPSVMGALSMAKASPAVLTQRLVTLMGGAGLHDRDGADHDAGHRRRRSRLRGRAHRDGRRQRGGSVAYGDAGDALVAEAHDEVAGRGEQRGAERAPNSRRREPAVITPA